MKTLAHASFGTRFPFPRIGLGQILTVMGERRRLREMTDRELADIGVTRDQARRESSRPFWDISPR